MATKKKAIWEWKIGRRALWDAFLKLNPRKMMGNPVMFVVEIGSVITTVLLFKGGSAFRFNLQIRPGKGPKATIAPSNNVFFAHDLGIAH